MVMVLVLQYIKAAPYSDLEELYRKYGYNINFWNNPIGCNAEF